MENKPPPDPPSTDPPSSNPDEIPEREFGTRFGKYLELVIYLKKKEAEFPIEERWRIHEEYEAVKQAFREGKIDWLGGDKFVRV